MKEAEAALAEDEAATQHLEEKVRSLKIMRKIIIVWKKCQIIQGHVSQAK
jgi:hypothetical protein